MSGSAATESCMSSRSRLATIDVPSKPAHGNLLALALTLAIALFGLIAVDLSAVCGTILISPTTLPTATQNSPFSQVFTAAGGTGPYSFTFAPGSPPPPWLLLNCCVNSTATLSGMPPAPGPYTFGLQATDSTLCAGVQNFTLNVVAAGPAFTVDFSLGSGVPPGTPITFSGSVNPAATVIASWSWDFGDGSTSTGQTVTHAFAAAGNYNVKLTATDSTGASNSVIKPVLITSPAPGFIVDFSPVSGQAGTPITFTGSVSPAATVITAWSWDFGDGSTATGQVVSHTFAVAPMGFYNVKLSAFDGLTTNSVTKPVTIAAACTTITLGPAALPPATQNSPYSQAITVAGGTPPYTFAFSGAAPAWLTLSPAGLLSGMPPASGTFTFTIEVLDSAQCSGRQTFTLNANGCPAITVTPSTLPNATHNSPYSQPLAGAGGTPPYTFAFAPAPPPPAWLTLSAGGVLSGTPAASGTFSFAVKVTDATGCSGVQGLTLNVTGGGGGPGFTIDFSPGSGSVGAPITFTGSVNPATTVITGWSWDFGDGSAATGQTVLHTFAAAGSYAVKLSATDGLTTSSITKPVIVTSPVANFTVDFSPVSGSVGTPIAFTGSVNPAATIITGWSWEFGDGSVASGQTVLHTFPAADSYNVKLTATSNTGATNSITKPVVIRSSCVTIVLGPAALPPATQNSPYSQPITVSGGTPPYTFTLSGSAPSWLTISAAGMLSGTPPAAGAFGFTVQVDDSAHCSGTQSFALTVNPSGTTCPPITISPAVLPNATPSSHYSQLLAAAGGTPPYAFTLLAGSLPAGLALSPEGTISGTPSAAGTFVFAIQATDASHCAGSRNYTIIVSTSGACLDKPALVSPVDGASNVPNPVTFTWTSAAGATDYKLLAFPKGTTPFAIGMTKDTAFTANVPNGTVEWYVVASFANCPDAESAHQTFTTGTCSNAAPVLTSPANGQTNVTLPVTFTWSAVPTAIGYNVLVVAATGTAPVMIGSTAGSTSLITSSVPEGTIQWYVQAMFASCPPVESSRNTFTMATTPSCGAAPPALTTPADGATSIALPVTFSWTAVSGASGYRLWASIADDSAKVIAAVRDTFVTTPVPPGKVEWYVEATFANCPSVFSTHFRFTVSTVATCGDTVPPALTSPPNGTANVSSPVTFQWTTVSNAVSYKVWGTIGAAAAIPSLFGVTTQTQLTVPVPQGNINWYVEALFANCPSTVSTTGSFAVATATDCSKNATPALLAPANGASNVAPPVQFTWSAATGASGYRLFVSVNGGSFDLMANTVTETSATRLVPDGTVQWYVEAQFNGCPALQSAKSTFTAKQALQCPTGSITLSSPSNGTSFNSPVAFAWSAISGTTTYRLWLSVDGGSPTIVGTTALTSLTTAVPSGAAEWYVEATFLQQCPSIVSPHGHFTVAKAVNCASNAPVSLKAPAEGATDVKSQVDFSWTASAGAVAYRVWVASTGSPLADVGTTPETHLTREISPGAVEWFVEAIFDGCPSVNSSKGHFGIPKPATCNNESPVPIAPAEGSSTVKSPVTFIWSAAANAVSYRVFASLDGGDPVPIGATVDASLTTQIPPGSINWFVNAVFQGCNDTQSARAHFTIPKDTTCPADAPALLSPADKATDVKPNATFAWTPVSNAIGYQLWVRSGDGNPTPMGPPTPDTQLIRQIPGGTVEWFVQAFFSGCKQTESKHATFTIPAAAAECDNPRPLLLSPPDGATNIASPVQFSWTGAVKATGYKIWASVDNSGASVIGSTTSTVFATPVPSGLITWYVEALFSNCPPQPSAPSIFTVLKTAPACSTPDRPNATVAAQVQSDTTYSVRWTPVPGANLYELQEATTPDFANATTTAIAGLSSDYNRTTQTAVPYFYRVRAVSGCSDDRGPYSDVVGVVLTPLPPSTQRVFNSSSDIGNQKVVVQTVFVPGFSTPVQFKAAVDKPWLTVTPSSGTLPADGITLTVQADPATLPLGTNTGTIILTYTTAGKLGAAPNGTTPPPTVPISVSIVTPVAPAQRNAPGPDSLIIPAVGHTEGSNNAKFQSDVRLTNVSAQTIKYQLNFTPTGPTGSQAVKQTLIQIDPGQTTALDDILSSFFGVGATASNASALGVLEIRPLTTATTGLTSKVSATTVVSSRTYNLTMTGSTYGQFIPAIPFSQFIGKSTDASKPNVLSIQQIAQSRDDTSGYRTNFAVVEAAGENADVLISVFSKDGSLLGTVPLSLAPGEHRQINRFLAVNNLYSDEARIEVQVTSTTGKVTAYASVIDNRTNDPLLVSPVLKSSTQSSRFVIPGVADLSNGVQNWRSDIRLFNPASSSVTATLVYYALGESTATKSIDITLKSGEVRAINDTLRSFFGLTGTGGAVHVLTAEPASLIVTARTYTDDQATSGTYGQFIPAVTPEQSIGIKDGALHVLQLEQSNRFRTNLGVAETSGNPATVEITVTLPDSKVTPKVQLSLGANEYRQIPVLTSLGLTTAYNARVSVRVIDGSGKVTAYGSVIDQVTGDPTYVPAQ